MCPFFTRTGDEGDTGLLGEGRVPKYDLRMETLGTLDEAGAALGLARSVAQSEQTCTLILQIQRDLYLLMTEVAATPEALSHFKSIGKEQVEWLEDWAHTLSEGLNIPKEFILPGDSFAPAALDLARTIVRRAERRMVELLHLKIVSNTELIRYLNRLSSLCFVLELYENQAGGHPSPTLAKISD
jgi:cob(I)alamin adenosyltransferase